MNPKVRLSSEFNKTTLLQLLPITIAQELSERMVGLPSPDSVPSVPQHDRIAEVA